MATAADIEELKQMCRALFLEIQEVRRRLDIEHLGLQDRDEDRIVIDRDLRHFNAKMRRLQQLNENDKPQAKVSTKKHA